MLEVVATGGVLGAGDAGWEGFNETRLSSGRAFHMLHLFPFSFSDLDIDSRAAQLTLIPYSRQRLVLFFSFNSLPDTPMADICGLVYSVPRRVK